jgi:hypothetical protein
MAARVHYLCSLFVVFQKNKLIESTVLITLNLDGQIRGLAFNRVTSGYVVAKAKEKN